MRPSYSSVFPLCNSLSRPAVPGIVPRHGNILIVTTIVDVCAVVVANPKRLVLCYRTDAVIPSVSFFWSVATLVAQPSGC
jgi:hypothetical protein